MTGVFDTDILGGHRRTYMLVHRKLTKFFVFEFRTKSVKVTSSYHGQTNDYWVDNGLFPDRDNMTHVEASVFEKRLVNLGFMIVQSDKEVEGKPLPEPPLPDAGRIKKLVADAKVIKANLKELGVDTEGMDGLITQLQRADKAVMHLRLLRRRQELALKTSK